MNRMPRILFGFLAAVLWQTLILLTYIMAVATILGLATVGPLSLVVPVLAMLPRRDSCERMATARHLGHDMWWQ